MDRLIEAIEEAQNPSIVGLDPTPALVPPQVVDSFTDEVRESIEDESELPAARLAVAYFEFNRAIIDAVADIVPAVKPQIAMYEAIGPAGVDTYTMTCEYAQQQGLYVLGDIKRGDIGSTAAAYAGHLSGVTDGDGLYDPWHEDAVTVNPYLGTDGITPFVEAATAHDKDIFVLVRTSNPSSSELQELELAGGEKLYERTADLVEGWGADTIGRHGYSHVARSSARPIRRRARRLGPGCPTLLPRAGVRCAGRQGGRRRRDVRRRRLRCHRELLTRHHRRMAQERGIPRGHERRRRARLGGALRPQGRAGHARRPARQRVPLRR